MAWHTTPVSAACASYISPTESTKTSSPLHGRWRAKGHFAMWQMQSSSWQLVIEFGRSIQGVLDLSPSQTKLHVSQTEDLGSAVLVVSSTKPGITAARILPGFAQRQTPPPEAQDRCGDPSCLAAAATGQHGSSRNKWYIGKRFLQTPTAHLRLQRQLLESNIKCIIKVYKSNSFMNCDFLTLATFGCLQVVGWYYTEHKNLIWLN